MAAEYLLDLYPALRSMLAAFPASSPAEPDVGGLRAQPSRLVTWFFMPSELIQYGVLTLLGFSALLMIPLHKLLKRVPPLAGLFCSFGLFLLLRNVPNGSLGFEGLRLCTLPDWLYGSELFAVLGFPSPAFSSSDYFPLIPWFFLFVTGYFLWSLLSRQEKALKCLHPGFAPLAFLGRHSPCDLSGPPAGIDGPVLAAAQRTGSGCRLTAAR